MTVQRVDLNIENFKTIQENFKKIAIGVVFLSILVFFFNGFSIGTFFIAAFIFATVCFPPSLNLHADLG